jgi:hypothetical protein
MASQIHFLCVLLATAVVPTLTSSQTYTIRFEGTDFPLSEGGKWTNTGVDWAKIGKAAESPMEHRQVRIPGSTSMTIPTLIFPVFPLTLDLPQGKPSASVTTDQEMTILGSLLCNGACASRADLQNRYRESASARRSPNIRVR